MQIKYIIFENINVQQTNIHKINKKVKYKYSILVYKFNIIKVIPIININ